MILHFILFINYLSLNFQFKINSFLFEFINHHYNFLINEFQFTIILFVPIIMKFILILLINSNFGFIEC